MTMGNLASSFVLCLHCGLLVLLRRFEQTPASGYSDIAF